MHFLARQARNAVCLLLAATLWLSPTPSRGQAPTAGGARPAESVREHEPVYLRDKDGTLVPVLNYTLEDFDQFVELRNQLNRGQMRPRSTLQRLLAVGEVKGQFARLKVECDVLLSATGWVRVPLRMPEAVLVQTPTYQGPTKFFSEFDGSAGGYAAWFFGNGEQVHQLSWEVLVPVERLSGRHRLRLTAPRAAQSELQLRVPLAGAEASVAGSGVLDTTPAGSAGAKTTSLVVRALDGEMELTWWPATRQAVESTPDLEAVGVLLSRVDGRSVRTDATFTVRSSGGEYRFDSFRIRVPRGANLFPTEQPGVRFSGPVNAGGARLVDVALDEPTIGPVEIRLSTERPYNIAKKDELVELAGFEVVDALRQWGYIGVQVDEQWQISLMEKHPGVRQVENLPDALRQEDLVAGFEYSGQPCSLQARVFQRETRIAVEPEYEVRVEPTRMHLLARLKYRVPGTKVFYVNIDLRGWQTEADRIGPVNLVNQDQIAPQLLTPLTIPLLQPLKGEFEITLEAWKPIERGATSLEFFVPLPTAHNLVTSQLLIVPAENVQLIPTADRLVNLNRKPAPRKFQPAAGQQEPLFYLGDETQGQFVSDFRILPRKVSVGLNSKLRLSEREVRIEQELAYKVAHEAVDRVVLEVPRAVADSNQLEVSLDGRLLPLSLLPEQTPQPDKPLLMYASLTDETGKPTSRLGSFTLLVRYGVTHEALLPEASVSVDVPLVMPAEGELTGNDAAVVAEPGLKATYRQGDWSPASTPGERLDEPAGLQLAAQQRVSIVPLALQMESKRGSSSIVVRRAWIQSHLLLSGRQDRAVYRFATSAQRLELRLPRQVILDDTAVWLDGRSVSPQIGADRRLILELPDNDARQEHVLELAYRFAGRETDGFPALLEAPQLPEEAWVRRLYWQVLTPPYDHLLFTPKGFVSESTWRFGGLFFGRQPLRSQAELQMWSGGLPQEQEVTPAMGNAYLFSSLGPIQQLELWTIRRTWLVLASSLMALGLGLLLIYLPALRRALVLVFVAVVTSLGLLYPEPVLMLLQAASLGAALVLLAAVLERVVSSRHSRAFPGRRGLSSVVHRSQQPAERPAAPAPSQSSTRTAAVAAAASGPEAGT